MAFPATAGRFLRANWRPILVAASALEYSVIGLVYALRPDWAAVLTLLPFWLWVIPGIVLALAAPPARSARTVRTARRIVIAAWLVALYVIAEEPRSLLKPVGSLDKPQVRGYLRVISLNCAGGDPAAAAEVAPLHPDVVLLQESPTESQLPALAKSIWGSYGHYLAGMDTAILSRWPLERVDIPRQLRGSFLCAKLVDRDPPMELISLRLTAGLLRWEVWSPSCWSEQTRNRAFRRAQLAGFLPHLQSIPKDTIVILGGDFNAPQGDPVCRMLEPRLQDAFSQAGRGWGNTIPNEWPLLRIDQIWLSNHFSPDRVFALQTVHSDHRMVVADLNPWQ